MKPRLSKDEIETIVRVCLSGDPEAIVYLYGSRIDPMARGGDIDLLILSDRITFGRKLDLLSALKERLGDQKIDVTVLTKEQLMADVFFREVAKIRL